MSAEERREAARYLCDFSGALTGEFALWIENLTGEAAEAYKMLLCAAESAALLHYFSDKRHTRIVSTEPHIRPEQLIERDGSNIQHLPLLRDTWDWYIKWMIELHRNKILKIHGTDKMVLLDLWDNDWDALKDFDPDMNEATIAQWRVLETKIYGAPVEDLATIYEHRPELAWVWDWRRSILDTLYQMQQAASRFPAGHPEAEVAIRRTFMEIPPATWLLIRLINAEETFENELQFWHVEDEHMRKRLFILDDKNMARLLPCTKAVPTWDRYEPDVLELARNISGKARRNYDYRLLRDWGRGRAWKKVELVVDTDGKKELKETVASVRGLFNTSGKLGFDLFGIHPIDMEDVKNGSDLRCPVCWEDWEDADLRITTYCDHQYHPQCIFQHWDLPGRLNFDCPKCRQPGRRILERVEIEDWKIKKRNDKDMSRFDDEELEEFDELVATAQTWESDPDQEYAGVEAGWYGDMPDELWMAWAKSIRRDLVQDNLDDDACPLSNKALDPIADWPRPTLEQPDDDDEDEVM